MTVEVAEMTGAEAVEEVEEETVLEVVEEALEEAVEEWREAEGVRKPRTSATDVMDANADAEKGESDGIARYDASL